MSALHFATSMLIVGLGTFAAGLTIGLHWEAARDFVKHAAPPTIGDR